MSVSLSKLGLSTKCPKCEKEYGSIMTQKVTPKDNTVYFQCPKCDHKFSRKYSINQYVRMANAGLIVPNSWIRDFQRKFIVETGQYIRLDDGIDGIVIVRDQDIDEIREWGKKLLDTTGNFPSLTFSKFKKESIVFNAYYPMIQKTRKFKMPARAFLLLEKAQIIDHKLAVEIKDLYRQEFEGFDVEKSYGLDQSTLSSWAQEALGMVGEQEQTKCYICGNGIGPGMDRCPNCGSDL